MKAERCALLREDLFDLLIISAPPSILPWSTERMRFLRRYYPSLPLSSIDCDLSTIDASILSETSDQFPNSSQIECCNDQTTASQQCASSSATVLSNITNQVSANQYSTRMASYRQLKNAVDGTVRVNFWMNCFKLISESDEALELFVRCLDGFLVDQKVKKISKKKHPIVPSGMTLLDFQTRDFERSLKSLNIIINKL